MRVKDDLKQNAIIKATIKAVNKGGFDSASVAKIAKEAKVSPATIYIYYKNKEDLILSTYKEVKKRVSEYVLRDFNESIPVRDIFEKVWENLFLYVSENSDEFKFKEQFANSPYLELVDLEEVNSYFEPLMQVMQRGIDEKIIKDADHDILCVFIFYPVMILANARLFNRFELTDKNMKTAFNMAWDAIKF
jgi:AcrR family transcriptional regulator